MHGQYAMSWSGQASLGCSFGQSESFTGSVSQTISFGTRRSARRWGFVATVFDRQLHRRVTYLVFSNRYRAPGTKIGPNDFGSAKLATPALFTRSAGGTYVPCDGPPRQIGPIPCQRVAVPSFRAVLSWSPFRPTGGLRPTFDTEEATNHNPYGASCEQQDTDYEVVLGRAGVPGLEADHVDAFIPSPGSARFMNARVGSMITTHFDGNPYGWSPSYSRLSVKLTFRRVR